jgi:hypothetical protein
MSGNFEFVSVVPTSDGRAKPNRQALVRKNAAKYQWRHNKPAKVKASTRREPVSRTASNDRSVVLVEQDDGDPDGEKEVTGYGLHASRLVSAT